MTCNGTAKGQISKTHPLPGLLMVISRNYEKAKDLPGTVSWLNYTW